MKSLAITLVSIFTLGVLMLGGCSYAGTANQSAVKAAAIRYEYQTAVEESLTDLENELNKIDGDFSFEDKTILEDDARLTAAKAVVTGTVKADNMMFEAWKSAVDTLKVKHAGDGIMNADLQKAYEKLTGDFEDLKKLDNRRGDAMIIYLDFVMANNDKMKVTGEKVIFTDPELQERHDALEKAALEIQESFEDEQNKILDRQDADLKTFSEELAK